MWEKHECEGMGECVYTYMCTRMYHSHVMKSLLHSYISEGMRFSMAVYLWGFLCGSVSCARELDFCRVMQDGDLGCHEEALWKWQARMDGNVMEKPK